MPETKKELRERIAREEARADAYHDAARRVPAGVRANGMDVREDLARAATICRQNAADARDELEAR